MHACDASTGDVYTEVFDGPLELLLFLVKREGVDLCDLRIAPITDAYLAQLELLQALDLDLAGEFLVMAATLCFLKSQELLPRRLEEEGQEEEEDPELLREALVRRLQEYERYREASLSLGQRPMLGREIFARAGAAVPRTERPLDPGVDALGLLQIFYEVLQRHAEPPPVHEVHREVYSLKDMAEWLLGHLSAGPRSLHDLLGQLAHPADRVVAFLATLEMARLQLLDVQQSHHLGPIVLRSQLDEGVADLTALQEGA